MVSARCGSMPSALLCLQKMKYRSSTSVNNAPLTRRGRDNPVPTPSSSSSALLHCRCVCVCVCVCVCPHEQSLTAHLSRLGCGDTHTESYPPHRTCFRQAIHYSYVSHPHLNNDVYVQSPQWTQAVSLFVRLHVSGGERCWHAVK